MCSIARSPSRVKALRAVHIEAQGSVLKVKREGYDSISSCSSGGPRGRVYGFSRASRKRLLEKVGRLELEQVPGHRHCATMITLTYAGPEDDLPTIEQTKRDKRAFVERVRRRFPQASAILRLEFESSGARDYHPHWHLLFFGLPYVDKSVINAWWAEIVGPSWSSESATRIEAVRSKRGAMAYAAKYCGKAGGGLVHGAYPHAGGGSEQVNEAGLVHTGRVWSVFNRACLPFADLITLEKVGGRWFYDFKRLARRRWAGVNDHAEAGFTLFVDDPERWLEAALGPSYSRLHAPDGVLCLSSIAP